MLAAAFLNASLSMADQQSDRILAAAKKEADALRAGDYDTVISLMYHKALELYGGAAKAKEIVSTGMADMKSRGISFGLIEFGQPQQTIAANGKVFSIVPQTVVLTAPDSKITQKSFLLAISEDSGATWTFLDAAGLNPETISQVVPELPSTIKLPQRVPPTKEPK